MDDVVKDFLVESYENLNLLDRALVDLEKDPGNRDSLAKISRTIRTIKGSCGFLGFGGLESIAHVGENLLSRLRDGQLQLNAERTTGLLALVDTTRRVLAIIEEIGTERAEDHSALIATLNALQTDTPAPAAAPAPAPAPAPTVPEETIAALAAVDPRSGEDRRSGGDRRGSADEAKHGLADTSLRVDVVLLDKLMNLVGELVLARNQILQFNATQTDSAFVAATQRLNLVTSELQEGVMKTRMQPIDTVWSKFPRVVRDLATMCGKQVRLEMVGKETELDKTIIEAIRDPLTHVVRNSADHGIERPEVRVAAGKSPEGTVALRAFHEGGQINIEISDDGGGISADTIRRKAVERAMITADQAGRLSDRDALRLIFLPGFSTAEKITNVSGRGVGMDVVKTNIEKIGGAVDIDSTVGTGTTIKIRIPLTLAIIPALMVSTGGETFAIPQVSLLELVRVEGEALRTAIETIGRASFYRLRGNLLPLVSLHRELGLAACGEAGVANIVVLQADDQQFGLVVDAVNDTEEIVVKPLGKQLKSVQVFAGATILGDGHVALILDAAGVARHAGVVRGAHEQRMAEEVRDGARADAEVAETWMLFQTSGADRMAIPLELVARLEEFADARMERSGGQDVVQYRGDILPLVHVAEVLGGQPVVTDEARQVIVVSDGGRTVGLVVDRILDIVSERAAARRATSRPGVIGSVVLQQRVTDLLDVPAIVRQAVSETAA